MGSAGVRVEYECADGTPFVVTFDSEEQAAMTWELEREHLPHRLTPLAAALAGAEEGGASRCYEEVGTTLPPFFRPGPPANGFAYFCSSDPSPEEMGSLMAACAALVERYGSAKGVWEDYSLPKVREDVAAMDAAGPEVPLVEVAALQGHAQHLTMLPAYILGHDLDQLAELAAGPLGGEPRLAAQQLTQGFPSTTLQADKQLWQLGRMVSTSDALRRAIDGADPREALDRLRDAGEEPEFFAALDDLMAVFGRRAEHWEAGAPTWAEMGPGFFNQLRTMAHPDAVDPDVALAAGARRRAEAVARVEAALADDAEQLARFRRRLDRCAPYVAVREERALWQLISVGALRGAALRRGQALVDSGHLDAAGDVMFLLPDEVDGPVSDDLRSLVKERRAEHERWSALEPPHAIGAPKPDAGGTGAPGAGAGTAQPDQPADRKVLAGVAGSRGVATGPARVIRTLADADQFEPGDVLVCMMTSPPWTPLFGLAAAVVTDTGDTGSHAAIAAREYGIPCVLKTGTATTSITDGALVTVDGDAGTVTLA